jgi:hypothetical protein
MRPSGRPFGENSGAGLFLALTQGKRFAAEDNGQGQGQEHAQYQRDKGDQEDRNLMKRVKNKGNIAAVIQIKADKTKEDHS